MYKEHFCLKETPFSIAPDPRYLYMSAVHQEALAHLVYGIQGDGGFALLTGEIGAGKTTVCRRLLEQAPENTNIAFILNPKLTAGELLAAICDELEISYPEGNGSIKVFVDCINAFLLESHAKGRNTVLIIEEAQNLSADVLEQLRLLTNLETDQRKLLQIIMVGQPELQEKLSRPELRQLAQRITARYHLGPLSKRDTAAYVSHRLAVAGLRNQLFLPSALGKLFRLSRGTPRLINVICDRALLGAYVQGKERVDASTLSLAAREVLGAGIPGRMQGAKYAVFAAAAFALIICSALFAAPYFRRGAAQVVSPAQDTRHPRIDTLWWFGDDSFLWRTTAGHLNDAQGNGGGEQGKEKNSKTRFLMGGESPAGLRKAVQGHTPAMKSAKVHQQGNPARKTASGPAAGEIKTADNKKPAEGQEAR